MPPQKTTRPATQSRMLQQSLLSDPQTAQKKLSDGISAVETKLGALQKLITNPPTVTGSKGGNAALASLIAALVQLGLIKDQTT